MPSKRTKVSRKKKKKEKAYFVLLMKDFGNFFFYQKGNIRIKKEIYEYLHNVFYSLNIITETRILFHNISF